MHEIMRRTATAPLFVCEKAASWLLKIVRKEMGQVKLMGLWASPYSLRIKVALKIKGVDYEYVEEDMIRNKSQQIVNYNPVHKKVPVLIHTGKPIVESVVILEYIDETWKGNPLLPQDSYDRAQARFWAKFIDDQLNSCPCSYACIQTTFLK
ncbi:hypothetical protein Cgig2_018688 [Carnegiea gigantea]|uniref:Glutathione S-transferase n=1 Tax=Carnegiea gigantea TaxID=171969 RepID=A0A9Q1Q738_9CARY|nr:hypothetical protein Cgig2_018688 [Carnegiea gigantea]